MSAFFLSVYAMIVVIICYLETQSLIQKDEFTESILIVKRSQ